MTNEEKAREIANLHKITYVAGLKNERGTSFIECMGSAYQMAEWKDQQFTEEFELIKDWFNHIAQIADDKKTLNGFAMKDSDAFDEIKCLAKRCADYIENELYKK